MPKRKFARKRRFDAALKHAGMTGLAWCRANGVEYSHLYRVLTGERESGRLSAKIDAFLAEHTPNEHGQTTGRPTATAA
jgi:hypothetical protein